MHSNDTLVRLGSTKKIKCFKKYHQNFSPNLILLTENLDYLSWVLTLKIDFDKQIVTFYPSWSSYCRLNQKIVLWDQCLWLKSTLSCYASLLCSKSAVMLPMGWSSWNTFFGEINEDKVIGIADAIKRLKLDKFGYIYLTIDDFWNLPDRHLETQR